MLQKQPEAVSQQSLKGTSHQQSSDTPYLEQRWLDQ